MTLKKFNRVHHNRDFILEILHLLLFLESLCMKIFPSMYLTSFHHLLHAEIIFKITSSIIIVLPRKCYHDQQEHSHICKIHGLYVYLSEPRLDTCCRQAWPISGIVYLKKLWIIFEGWIIHIVRFSICPSTY